MYIAVAPYTQNVYNCGDKVLVLDTSDLTLEEVPELDLYKSIDTRTCSIDGVRLVCWDWIENKYSSLVTLSTFFLSNPTVKDNYLFYTSEYGCWNTCGTAFQSLTWVIHENFVSFNNTNTIELEAGISGLCYLFRYREYIVYRFRLVNSEKSLSVAIDKDSDVKSVWYSGSSFKVLYGDKSIALRIDTVSKY